MLEVGGGGGRLAIGLVGDRPHDHGRVVLVAGDQLAHHVEVLQQRLAHHVLVLQADGGRLADDDDAELVAELQRLGAIRVVRGAHRVAADPLVQRHVLHEHRQVQPAAAHVGVLVLPKAVEVEGLAVDQERAVGARAHRPDAVRQPVHVGDVSVGAEHLDLDRVQVAGALRHVARPPQRRVRDGEAAAAPHVRRHPAARHQRALGVAQRDQHRRRADGGDEDVEVGVVLVDAAGDGDVVEVGQGRGVQQHLPLDPRVVEEVHLQPLHAPPRHVRLHPPRRDRRRVQRVVDGDRQPRRAPEGDERRVERQVERQVAALVLAHQHAVEPDARVVVRRADVQHHALRRPVQRHEDGALVPHDADEVAQRLVLRQVVVRRGHRHHRVVGGQAGLRPAARRAVARIGFEAPETIQRLDLARLRLLRQ